MHENPHKWKVHTKMLIVWSFIAMYEHVCSICTFLYHKQNIWNTYFKTDISYFFLSFMFLHPIRSFTRLLKKNNSPIVWLNNFICRTVTRIYSLKMILKSVYVPIFVGVYILKKSTDYRFLITPLLCWFVPIEMLK